MGSSCFGLYWDGREASECREGKGCSAINDCLAKFATSVLAGHQRSLGPKKSTPKVLGELTSVHPEAIALAMNWQKNTGFSPFVVRNEERKATKTVVEYQGEDTELEEISEDFDPEMFDEVDEEALTAAELRAAQEPIVSDAKKEKATRRRTAKEDKGDAVSGSQFCEKCKGTGKRGRGVCKACVGTGKAASAVQPVAAERSAVQVEMVKGASQEPVSGSVAAGDETETVMARGNTRSNSVSRTLHVQGEQVPDAVFASSGNSGGEGLPKADRSAREVSRGQKTRRNAKVSVMERPEVFQTASPNTGGKKSTQKPQVVVDTYNKRVVGVNWPDYPSIMETPEEKIVQIIAWDTTRNGCVKWVPQLSGDPNELLFKSLCQG